MSVFKGKLYVFTRNALRHFENNSFPCKICFLFIHYYFLQLDFNLKHYLYDNNKIVLCSYF